LLVPEPAFFERPSYVGKLADTRGQFLSKGRAVNVEGRLSTREYQARDGSGQCSVTEIVAPQSDFSAAAAAPLSLKPPTFRSEEKSMRESRVAVFPRKEDGVFL
jgi:single-stranded DNA-binding protein